MFSSFCRLVVSIRSSPLRTALKEKQRLYPSVTRASRGGARRQIARRAPPLGIFCAALDVAYAFQDALSPQKAALGRHEFRLLGFHAASRCSSSKSLSAGRRLSMSSLLYAARRL